MREPDRQRHQVGGLVARVAEHHPLVAGTLAFKRVLAAVPVPHLGGDVDALAMSGDCSSSETITPQVIPENPLSSWSYPMSQIVFLTMPPRQRMQWS